MWKRPKIKHLKPTKWGWMVSYPEGLFMDRDVDVGAFTYIQAEGGVHLEYGVQIGSHCSIYSKSTIDNKKGMIFIDTNACIGSHCIIMPKISIGANSIIGAHSFVNKNIPPNVVAWGVPCRVQYKLGEKRGN